MARSAPATYKRRQYRRPPVQEALCELRFPEGAFEWNPTVPGLYFEKIREEYPQINQEAPVTPVTLSGGSSQLTIAPITVGVQFTTADGSARVALTPQSLAVTVAAPYPGWEAFHDRIEAAVNSFGALGLPDRIARVGLRYINRIDVPSESVRLADYFESPPTTPDDFPENFVGVVARWESVYEDEPDMRLIYTFASLPAEEGRSAFLVDLDVIKLFDQPADMSAVVAELTEMKKRETAAFEAVIRDPLREQFDAE